MLKYYFLLLAMLKSELLNICVEMFIHFQGLLGWLSEYNIQKSRI